MGLLDWSKVLLFFASCSVVLVTECSPSLHHKYPLSLPPFPTHHYPAGNHGNHVHSLSNNNVYGGQSGQHHYSYASKGPHSSSYQSVTRTFKHHPQPWAEKPHKPWPQKPWMQKPHKPWTQRPWQQKPTEKPWVHPTHAPLKPAPTPSVITQPPTLPTTTAPATIPSTTPSTTTPPTTTPLPTTPPPTTTTPAPTTPSTTTTTPPPATTSPPITTSIPTTAPPSSTTPPPTPALIPDIDIDIDYYPFPAPIEDIDLPSGPPAILRPSLRTGTDQTLTQPLLYTGGRLYRYNYPVVPYLHQLYNYQVNNYL